MPYKMIYTIIFLPLICYLGLVTSHGDFLSSRIKNKWILIGLLYSFVMYLVAWLVCICAQKEIMHPKILDIVLPLVWNFDKWCINLLVSIIVAYLLWHFKLWGAGDAKLFIVYSALIPIGQYRLVYFNYYFASFLLLLTIFIPATLFFFFRSLAYLIMTFKFSQIMQRFFGLIKERLISSNKIQICKILLGFFLFFLIFRILRYELGNLFAKILPDQNIIVLLSLLAFRKLSNVFKNSKKSLLIVSLILIIYIGFKIVNSQGEFILRIGNSFAMVIFIVIAFPIIKRITDIYIQRTTRKTTPFAHWMFLGALITWFI